jgi:PAS domain S-box-containing protein
MTRKHKVSPQETVAELLRKSEQKISSILASITDYHFELDKDWRFLRINDQSLAYFGRKKEELIGQSYFEVFPALKGSIFKEQYNKAVSKSASVHFDVESVLYPGKWIEVHAYPTEQRGVSVFFRDNTERKRADAETKRLTTLIQEERDRLSALVNSIQDEVWFADAEGRFTLTNPSASREFGFDASTEEINVEEFAQSLEVHRPDGSYRPIDEAPPLRALKGEIVRNQEEIIRTPASGELRYREVSSSPVRDAAHNIIGSVSVVRDITGRKKIENQLKDYQEHLEKLVEDRTRELRMKSISLEEVNTALKVLLEQREKDKNELEDNILLNVRKLILPYLDSLKRRQLDDEQRTYLDVLETNLKNIISPFARKLTSIHENFTPQEIKVADLIRYGKTVKEIAGAFGVSESAINLHRQHMRNKLGLNNQKINLRTYLLSLT